MSAKEDTCTSAREHLLSNVMSNVRTCLTRLKDGDLFMGGLEKECYDRLQTSITTKNDDGTEEMTKDFLKFLDVVAEALVKEAKSDETPENSKNQKKIRERWLAFLRSHWKSVEQEIRKHGKKSAAPPTTSSAVEEATRSKKNGDQPRAEDKLSSKPQKNKLNDSDANSDSERVEGDEELDGDDCTSHSSASYGRTKKKSKKKKEKEKEKTKSKEKRRKKLNKDEAPRIKCNASGLAGREDGSHPLIWVKQGSKGEHAAYALDPRPAPESNSRLVKVRWASTGAVDAVHSMAIDWDFLPRSRRKRSRAVKQGGGQRKRPIDWSKRTSSNRSYVPMHSGLLREKVHLEFSSSSDSSKVHVSCREGIFSEDSDSHVSDESPSVEEELQESNPKETVAENEFDISDEIMLKNSKPKPKESMTENHDDISGSLDNVERVLKDSRAKETVAEDEGNISVDSSDGIQRVRRNFLKSKETVKEIKLSRIDFSYDSPHGEAFLQNSDFIISDDSSENFIVKEVKNSNMKESARRRKASGKLFESKGCEKPSGRARTSRMCRSKASRVQYDFSDDSSDVEEVLQDSDFIFSDSSEDRVEGAKHSKMNSARRRKQFAGLGKTRGYEKPSDGVRTDASVVTSPGRFDGLPGKHDENIAEEGDQRREGDGKQKQRAQSEGHRTAKATSLWEIHNAVESSVAVRSIKKHLPRHLQNRAQNVAEFFFFCHERQRIWVKRNSGEDRPWTEDALMDSKFFCNIYRELDRGSTYFRQNFLERIKQKAENLLEQTLWDSLCYRLLNRIETFMLFGKIPSLNEWPDFVKMISDLNQNRKVIFTGAHQVMGFSRYIATMSSLCFKNGLQLKKITAEIAKRKEASDLKGCVKVIESIANVGTFFAWQVICDLLESKLLLPCSEEDYVKLGPGATAGIETIFGHKENKLALAKLLRDIQHHAFAALKVRFPFFHGRNITLKNIEHGLCEYQKYKSASGASRVFDPDVSGRGSRSYLDVGKVCSICTADGDGIIFCDTCLSAYCTECVEVDDSVPWWLCKQCLKLEIGP